MQLNRAAIHRSLFFTGIVVAMSGFMFSRALLSIGTFILIANGCLQNDLKERFAAFFKYKVVAGISCLFLLPFISGLWSDDKATWGTMMLDKLPLLLMPFALVLQKGFERKQFTALSLFWILLLFGGSVWSTIQYMQQRQLYHELYRFSKTIPTWAGNDHIRFSMGIVVGILLWLKLEEWKVIHHTVVIWLMRVMMIWFVLFLHILGAKTGLIGCYFILLPLLIWQLFTTGKKRAALYVLASACILPIVSYCLLPTFKTRMHYILYDRENWVQGNINGNFSDGNRLLSMQSGWHVFQKNWLTGVGYGDIRTATDEWYNTYAPEVTVERYLPLNQWLTSGSGAGIVAVLLFTVIILLPLFTKDWQKNKQSFAFFVYMNFIFMFETTIDDQFGVFIFCFFTLYWHLSNLLKT